MLVLELFVAAFHYPGFLKQNGLIEYEGDVLPTLTEEELERALEDMNFTSGISSIFFDTNAPREESRVSREKPKAEFSCGVSVVFDDFCLSDTAKTVSVAALGSGEDADFDAAAYDFLLDGQEAEFYGLAEITLPYDESWGDNVFVQYFNEKTGAWEVLYSEPNGDGTVTFRTDHFCTFAVFKQKVESGRTSYAPIFKEVQGENEYDLKVYMNWDALATIMREGKLTSDASLRELTGQGNTYFADRTITTLGNINSGLDYTAKLANMPGLSNKVLGPLGQVITISKFLYQGHKYGWSKSFSDNKGDLAMLVVGAGSSLPPPVGTACLAITAGYYLYSMTDAVATDIGNSGFSSPAEYAYRDFSMNYLTYSPTTGRIGYRVEGKRDILGDVDPVGDAKKTYNADYRSLQSGSRDAETAQWYTVFENAMAREKIGQMKADKYVDQIIDQYVNVFWRLPPKVRDEYLSRTPTTGLVQKHFGRKLKEDYAEPTQEEKDRLTKTFRGDLCAWLKPYFEKQLEKQYQESLNAVYRHFMNLWLSMNQKYTVTLEVPGVSDWTDTDYYPHPMGLSTDPGSAPAINIDFTNATVNFTAAYWMKAGCPSVLRIMGNDKETWNKKDNFLVKTLDLKPGQNTVLLEDKTAATTTAAADTVTADPRSGADFTAKLEFVECTSFGFQDPQVLYVDGDKGAYSVFHKVFGGSQTDSSTVYFHEMSEIINEGLKGRVIEISEDGKFTLSFTGAKNFDYSETGAFDTVYTCSSSDSLNFEITGEVLKPEIYSDYHTIFDPHWRLDMTGDFTRSMHYHRQKQAGHEGESPEKEPISANYRDVGTFWCRVYENSIDDDGLPQSLGAFNGDVYHDDYVVLDFSWYALGCDRNGESNLDGGMVLKFRIAE